MALKQVNYKIKGMQQDYDKDIHNPEFSFENKNIRFTTNTNNGLLSIQTQKGTTPYTLVDSNNNTVTITGNCLGHATLNDYLILFVTNTSSSTNKDTIYLLSNIDQSTFTATVKVLFNGSLNFSINNPIETITYFENTDMQKIYWIDGLNQPRVIDITKSGFNNNSFDFLPAISLQEEVTIEKIFNSNGEFPVGTIQYALTYIGKNRQETSPFHTSSVLNTSYQTKGGQSDNNVTNNFNIILKGLDTSFEYVRLYSIVRTSLDSTPIVKRVIDIKLSSLPTITEAITGEAFNVPIQSTNQIKINYISAERPNSIIPFISLTRANIIYDLAFVASNFYIRLADTTNPFTITTLQNNDILILPKVSGYIKFNGYNMAQATITIVSGASSITAFYDDVLQVITIDFPSNCVITTSQGVTAISNVEIPITAPSNVDFQIYSNVVNMTLLLRVLNTGVSVPTSEQTSEWLAANTHTITVHSHFPDMKITTSFITNARAFVEDNTLIMYYNIGYNNIYVPTTINTCNRITIGSHQYLYNNYYYSNNTTLKAFNVLDIVFNSGQSNLSLYLDSTTTKLSIPSTVNYTINEFYYVTDAQTKTYAYTNFIDTNKLGETITSSKLLYTGGTSITPKTMEQKSNTLFFGNILLNKELVLKTNPFLNSDISFYLKNPISQESIGDLYTYTPQGLTFKNVDGDFESHKGFKSREWYRFGVQFQYKTGEWSEVFFIKDAQVNINPNITKGSNIKTQGINAQAVINYDFTDIYNKGFIKARGVVVFPEGNDREVVAQGVLNPTLYNIQDRYDSNPDVISSWIFRPFYSKYDWSEVAPAYGVGINTYNLLNGSFASHRHNCSLAVGAHSNSEIQSNGNADSSHTEFYNNYMDYPAPANPANNAAFRTKTSDAYFIDQSILTMHSPDIEFGNALVDTYTPNLKLRLIGFTSINGFQQDVSLEVSTPYNGSNARGFIKPLQKLNTWINNIDGGKELLSGGYVHSLRGSSYVKYVLHPWQANGSVCGYLDNSKGKLLSKKWSNLRYSDFNYYFAPTTGTSGPIEAIIADVAYFNPENDSILKLPKVTNSPLPQLIYQGNVDKIITFGGNNRTAYSNYYINSETVEMGTFSQDLDTYTFPIRIQTKSTPHAVIQLDWNSPISGVEQSNILPGQYWNPTYHHVAWKDSLSIYVNSISSRYPPAQAITDKSSGLWLAELYRDPSTITNRFGGTTTQALQNNTWIVAGEPVDLKDIYNNIKTSLVIPYTEGDTYFQRYDCLKTYGDSSYEQSLVEILSYYCESRVNLDSRTDNNRGLKDNRNMSPDIFNLFNNAYQQKNNYFAQSAIDSTRFTTNHFANTFTWTSPKVAGSFVDTWTNVTMSSTYDVDGNLGSIRSMKLFNDYLIGLQDKGMFNILYNSRVQINASDGTPIELALSGKVDGVKYISTNIGTKNSLSTCVTPLGIYFIDDEAKTINLFNGENKVLSDSAGIRSWIQQHHNFSSIIDVTDFSNFITTYDKINRDVYFINNEIAICYSEILGTFTSIYSYQNVFNFFNIGNYFMSINKDKSTTNNNLILYQNNIGNPGHFYGQYKNSYIQYLVNPEPTLNKVFDTISFTADKFDSNGNLILLKRPIDNISVTNEYQYGNTDTNDINLREKFRVWRGFIPRVNNITQNGFVDNPNKLSAIDRLRGTWAFITLNMYNTSTNESTIIHDTNFHYTV